MPLEAQKYIVTRKQAGWGDVLQNLIHALAYADKFKRTLVIDWSRLCYLPEHLKHKINAFPLFFDGIENIDTEVISGDEVLNLKFTNTLKLKRVPPWRVDRDLKNDVHEADILENAYLNSRDLKWKTIILVKGASIDFLNHQDKIKYYKKLRLKNEINNEIREYVNNNFKNNDHKIIGVHLRHGNGAKLNPFMLREKDINKIFKIYCSEIKNIISNKKCKIFVCTDSEAILNKFKERFDNVIYRKRPFVPEGMGSHPVVTCGIYHDVKAGKEYDLIKMAKDALIDMWLLSHTDCLIHNNSEFIKAPLHITEQIKDVIYISPHTFKVSRFPQAYLKKSEKTSVWRAHIRLLKKAKTYITRRKSFTRTLYRKIAFYLKWKWAI